MTTAKLNSTRFRWMSEILDHNFVVKYRPGKVHTDVDVLSRLILEDCNMQVSAALTVKSISNMSIYLETVG